MRTAFKSLNIPAHKGWQPLSFMLSQDLRETALPGALAAWLQCSLSAKLSLAWSHLVVLGPAPCSQGGLSPGSCRAWQEGLGINSKVPKLAHFF